jgi:hypothetical protein
MALPQTIDRGSRSQFSLKALFGYMTLCCILAALAGVLSLGGSICLMGLALALWAGQGGLALAMLMAAAVASGVEAGGRPNFVQQTLTVLVAAAICVGYQLRARRCSPFFTRALREQQQARNNNH